MSFTLTRTLPRTAIYTTLRLQTTADAVRAMSSNPAVSNPAKSETENRGPQFGFPERQPTDEEKKVMDDILNLCETESRESVRHALITPPITLGFVEDRPVEPRLPSLPAL